MGNCFHLLVIGLICPLVAAAEKYSFEQPLMGTRFSVVCHADDRKSAEKAANAAFSKAVEVENAASDYLPESELSQLSLKPVDQPIPLSPLLFDLLAHSRRVAKITGGAFDPTLGPLTKLWRESRKSGRLPDPETLAAARAATGWQHFTLDPDARSVTLHRKNMGFDLGAIAKGYAADRMLESLAAAGIRKALVTAGGDIRLGEPPPGRDGWRVALRTFDPQKSDEILLLSNAAVSTSGDLYQSVEIDGIRYSHILDPRTGLGKTSRVAASVIADEAKLSDPLATAACVVGPGERGELLRSPGVRDIRIRTMKDNVDTARKPPP